MKEYNRIIYNEKKLNKIIENGRKIMKLTPSQEESVYVNNNKIEIIEGISGSGKTIILLKKILYLFKTKDMKSSEILYLARTKEKANLFSYYLAKDKSFNFEKIDKDFVDIKSFTKFSKDLLDIKGFTFSKKNFLEVFEKIYSDPKNFFYKNIYYDYLINSPRDKDKKITFKKAIIGGFKNLIQNTKIIYISINEKIENFNKTKSLEILEQANVPKDLIGFLKKEVFFDKLFCIKKNEINDLKEKIPKLYNKFKIKQKIKKYLNGASNENSFFYENNEIYNIFLSNIEEKEEFEYNHVERYIVNLLENSNIEFEYKKDGTFFIKEANLFIKEENKMLKKEKNTIYYTKHRYSFIRNLLSKKVNIYNIEDNYTLDFIDYFFNSSKNKYYFSEMLYLFFCILRSWNYSDNEISQKRYSLDFEQDCNFENKYLFFSILHHVSVLYNSVKKKSNNLDITELTYHLNKNKESIREFKYKYIFLDDFEDVDKSLYESLVFLLNKFEIKKICFTKNKLGSVYDILGSNSNFFNETNNFFYGNKYYKTELCKNFRNNENLLNLCNSFIENKKNMSPNSEKILKIFKYKYFFKKTENLNEFKINSLLKLLYMLDKKADKKIRVGIFHRCKDNIYFGIINEKREETTFKNLDLYFMTAHNSKGRQFDDIFILDVNDMPDCFPTNFPNPELYTFIDEIGNKDLNESEALLFYYTMMSAKKHVYLLSDYNIFSSFIKRLEKNSPNNIVSYEIDEEYNIKKENKILWGKSLINQYI